MNLDYSKINKILNNAKKEGRKVLLETEGLDILKAMDIAVPNYFFLHSCNDVAKLTLKELPSTDKIVLKVVSPEILHKSDVGGVKIIDNNLELLCAAVSEMKKNLSNKDIRGFIISEFVESSCSLGSELLIGLRETQDFGPVLTFGPGGIYTEFLAKNFNEGHNVAIISPSLTDSNGVKKAINDVAITSIIAKKFRGQELVISEQTIAQVIEKFLIFAKEFIPAQISEFEVNPFIVNGGKLIALDALIRLSDGVVTGQKEKPIKKIKNLLEPKSAAIIGVSEKMNVGHIILNNFIKEGFNKKRLYVIKEGSETIEGCKCVSDIGMLPERVDLFVICTPASTIPEVITEIIEKEKAESIVVIPGGLEEKQGSGKIVSKMKEVILSSRKSKWQGPVINGGNCLGIISRPGKYDNMFIPDYKKTKVSDKVSPLAFISQSGAFAVSRLNKLAGINPKFSITIGNQMDLTLGDYLTYLKDDSEIKVFSIYLEGFKPLDGLKFLKAAKEITGSGRKIIFYTSGKTSEGAKAMASHTASIAGDYSVTKELAKRAGVVLAETFEDFEDLTRLFVYLEKREVRGRSLGVVSNAGCECVAASDNLKGFKLASFTEASNQKLSEIFKTCKIDSIVDLHNPIDLTPMAGDKAYEDTARIVLEDLNVDVAVIACIPLAPTLNALEKAQGHGEDYLSETSVVQRLLKVHRETNKPWVAVVDAGSLFDPMVKLFNENGIPTLRTIDRALKLFDIYCESQL